MVKCRILDHEVLDLGVFLIPRGLMRGLLSKTMGNFRYLRGKTTRYGNGFGVKNRPKLRTWAKKDTWARKNHLSRNYEQETRRRWRGGRGQEVFKCENIM